VKKSTRYSSPISSTVRC